MSSMTMENLFKKANLDYKTMTPFEFYDIEPKKLYTYSYNVDTGKKEKQQILSLVYKGESPIYEVRVAGSGDVLLKASGGHLLFDVKKNDYVEVQNIETATVLLATGQEVDVVIVKTDRTEPILDMEVDKNHNYYPNSVLSHNTGGRALKFYSSTRNRVTKIETIEKDGETIGIKMKVRNYKNKTGIMFREAEMVLYFETGFDSDAEYLDFFIRLGIIKQAGAWFSNEEHGLKVSGRAKVQEWLDANPEIFQQFKARVNELLAKETKELDSGNVAPDSAEEDSKEEATVASLVSQALDNEETPPELGLN